MPRWLRRLGLGLLGALLVLFIGQNHAEIPAAWRSLHTARVGLVGVAAICMALWLVNLAFLHAATQRAAGLHSHPVELLGPAMAGNFLNLVTKSGGMAGLPMFLIHGRHREQRRGRLVAAYLLTTVVLEMAFAATLLVALIVVGSDGRLTGTEIGAGAVFAVYLALRIALFVVAARSRVAIRALYRLPRRVLARLRRQPAALTAGASGPPCSAPDEGGSGHDAADELYDAMALIRSRPGAAVVAFGHAVLVEAIGIGELWAVMVAVGAGRSVVTAVVAYSVSVLFAIVGFLPGGIGFVEVSLGAVLVSFGATGAAAAAAVVLYRVFEMWLPILFGAAAAHVVRREALT